MSSPLKRCEQFARAFALDHALPLDIEARWREFHFGAWEGKTSAEIHAANPEHLTQFWNDPVRFPPPQGESFVAFRTRVLAAWNTLLIRYPGEHILVVTHGGPIRIILGLGRDVSWPDLLGLPVPLASLHTVRIAAAHVSSRCEPLTIPTC